MRKRIVVLALALGLISASGALYGATVDDFAVEFSPDTASISPSGGSVNFDVVLKTIIGGTQGWSFGAALTTADAGVDAQITALAMGAPIATIKNGAPADFKALNFYGDNLQDPPAGYEPVGDPPVAQNSCVDGCTGIVGAKGFTQGITIDIMTVIQLPATPDGIVVVEGTVEGSGPEGATATLAFSDVVGKPAIATVAVHGGLSYAPATQVPLVITFETPPCDANVVSGPDATVNACNQATITFETQGAATAEVVAEPGGITGSSPAGTSHTVVLTGLSGETAYTFEVTATAVSDSCQATASGSFTTPECENCQESARTIDVESVVASATGAEVTSVVTLNFDADGTQAGTTIQGWSYGLCVADPTKIAPIDCCPGPDGNAARGTAAIAGTDSEFVKNGAPPDFNSVGIFSNGAFHAVTIDIMTVIQIPAQNGYTDMKITYEVLMGGEDPDHTWVYPCNKTIGSPVVENVAVIGGFSKPFYGEGEPQAACETYGGTFDLTDAASGCAGGEDGACPKPGKIEYVPVTDMYAIAGSINGDNKVDIADGIFLLNYLFRSGAEPPCLEAADFNGDGDVDASDAVAAIFYVLNPTEDDLDQLQGDYGMPPWDGPALGPVGTCVKVEDPDNCAMSACTP